MEIQSVKWHLGQMQSEQEKYGIIKLRQRTFTGEDLDKEQVDFWNWEFLDNYAGKAQIYLAMDDGKIVGHYAVCPSKITVNGQEKRGSIVVDVMTDPDYRFQGMFTKLGQYSLENAGKQGIDFSYGFPIRKSVMPGHLKVGWKVAFPLPVYVYPISFTQIIKKFIPLKAIPFVLGILPQGLYWIYEKIREIGIPRNEIKITDKFENTKELQNFINKTRTQHQVMQVRNFDFLEWRYNQNHYRNYNIISLYAAGLLGYVVIRKSKIYDLDCLTIIDIQALECDKKIVRQLLLETRRFAQKEGVALIGIMANNNVYRKQMVKEGYIKSPYIFKMIIHDNSQIDYMDALMKDENWYLTWGDTDDL